MFKGSSNVLIYESERYSNFGGGVGLKKLDVEILGLEIIRTPKNFMIIVRCTDFFGRECSDLGVGG